MTKFKKELDFAKNYLRIKELPNIQFYEDFKTKSNGYYCFKTKIININLCVAELDYHCESIRTLFHELVHHKQFEAGKLKEINGVLFWKGKKQNLDSFENYWNSKHEIQARRITKNMLKKYNDK